MTCAVTTLSGEAALLTPLSNLDGCISVRLIDSGAHLRTNKHGLQLAAVTAHKSALNRHCFSVSLTFCLSPTPSISLLLSIFSDQAGTHFWER